MYPAGPHSTCTVALPNQRQAVILRLLQKMPSFFDDNDSITKTNKPRNIALLYIQVVENISTSW
jgi:hypothetical protein